MSEQAETRAMLDDAITERDALWGELETTSAALRAAWKLIGRLDYFLETMHAQPSTTRRAMAAKLRREIKKASEHGR